MVDIVITPVVLNWLSESQWVGLDQATWDTSEYNNITAGISANIAIAEKMSRATSKALSENIPFSDKVKKQSTKPLYDTFMCEELVGGDDMWWSALNTWSGHGTSVNAVKIGDFLGNAQWELTQLQLELASRIQTTTPLEANVRVLYRWMVRPGSSGKMFASVFANGKTFWSILYNFSDGTSTKSNHYLPHCTVHRMTVQHLYSDVYEVVVDFTPREEISSDGFGIGPYGGIGATLYVLRGASKGVRRYGVSKAPNKKPPHSNIVAWETIRKEQQRTFTSTLGMLEEFGRVTTISRNIGENIVFIDGCGKHSSKSLQDIFLLEDMVAKQNGKSLAEPFVLHEHQTDPSDYQRNHYELISVGSSVSKHLQKLRASSISAKSSFVGPNVLGVISDVAIRTSEITHDEVSRYIQSASAFGFGDWMPFVDGEYYFREALLKMVVQNTTPGAISGVIVPEHKVICDVYDISDKGVSNVNANPDGTFITFNKYFRDPRPIVTVTANIVSEFAVPNIMEVNRTGFRVILRKADGSPIQGEVFWQATGY